MRAYLGDQATPCPGPSGEHWVPVCQVPAGLSWTDKELMNRDARRSWSQDGDRPTINSASSLGDPQEGLPGAGSSLCGRERAVGQGAAGTALGVRALRLEAAFHQTRPGSHRTFSGGLGSRPGPGKGPDLGEILGVGTGGSRIPALLGEALRPGRGAGRCPPAQTCLGLLGPACPSRLQGCLQPLPPPQRASSKTASWGCRGAPQTSSGPLTSASLGLRRPGALERPHRSGRALRRRRGRFPPQLSCPLSCPQPSGRS